MSCLDPNYELRTFWRSPELGDTSSVEPLNLSSIRRDKPRTNQTDAFMGLEGDIGSDSNVSPISAIRSPRF